MKRKIYLDDVRTPKDPDWTVVRNYDEFVKEIRLNGLDDVEVISLDHDLGESAIAEYYSNVAPNYTLDYNHIKEKTGLHCAKWLVEYLMSNKGFFPTIYTHSANPIGSANIMGYVNNYLANIRQPQTCVRVKIPHTV